jgi:asparagine N-glycosylation enzyme membrane subunit Stt3
MQMSLKHPLWGRLVLFVAGTGLMLFCAYSVHMSAYVNGEYIPQNADAFYHARRILDAVMTGHPVIQFDPRMHVPQGSWITWPWAYDQTMAWIVSLFGPYSTQQQAAHVLFVLPLTFIPVTIALMVWLTWQLRLPLGMSVLAVLALAAVPQIFMLYALGNVDHHDAEQIWTLLLLNGAVWMLRAPASRAAPVFLGVALGTAVGVQNGLFMLPVVLVLALAIAWLRGLPLPDHRRLHALAVSLLLATLAVCIPSQQWRNGVFSYLELSWFQLYVAAVCAAYIVWIAHAGPSRRNLVLMATVGVAVLVAALVPIESGLRFASGRSDSIRNVVEAISPYSAVSRLGPGRSTRLFTWMMWFSLPAMVLCVWWAIRSSKPGLVVFAAISTVLLLLMQSQVRFDNLGMMSLVITLPMAAEELAARRHDLAKVARLGIVLLVCVCFLPTKGIYATLWLPGDSYSYGAVRQNIKLLARNCATKPGVVLAPLDAGHWIRYHTDCSVIANAFVLSPLQVAKVQELHELLQLSPEQLRASRPDVLYVLAYMDVGSAMASGMMEPTEADIQAVLPDMPKLMGDLLRTDRPLPEGYKLLSAAQTRKGGIYARVFEIEH